MLIQLFVPGYYGSEITAASDKLSTSLFHSGWLDEKDENFKSAMSIFMEKVKKPKVMSIFGVYDVDLGTFSMVCKASYSLFAVFKSMGD